MNTLTLSEALDRIRLDNSPCFSLYIEHEGGEEEQIGNKYAIGESKLKNCETIDEAGIRKIAEKLGVSSLLMQTYKPNGSSFRVGKKFRVEIEAEPKKNPQMSGQNQQLSYELRLFIDEKDRTINTLQLQNQQLGERVEEIKNALYASEKEITKLEKENLRLSNEIHLKDSKHQLEIDRLKNDMSLDRSKWEAEEERNKYKAENDGLNGFLTRANAIVSSEPAMNNIGNLIAKVMNRAGNAQLPAGPALSEKKQQYANQFSTWMATVDDESAQMVFNLMAKATKNIHTPEKLQEAYNLFQ